MPLFKLKFSALHVLFSLLGAALLVSWALAVTGSHAGAQRVQHVSVINAKTS